MRILYLVSRENILEPGVLKSQVLDLASQIIKSSGDTEITVLSFPSINRFFKYFKNYSAIKKYSRERGVRLLTIPIFPIGRSIMPTWAIPFFLVQTVPWVLFFRLLYRFDTIHARAYLSALIGRVLRKIGFKIGLVFDVRGAYLLEGITYGRWKRSDPDYGTWERLEEKLFSDSDRVVVQSSGLMDYVQKIAPAAKVELIPPGVNEQTFAISEKDRERGRREFGIEKRFVVVYSGSLGNFHEPDFLAKCYSVIRKDLPNPYFLAVTHSNPGALVASLQNHGIPGNEFKVVSSPKDIGKVLPLGDAGLHIMDDLPITPTVVSVKFGEYLASGLPVIVTKNMASVTNLVEEHRCGVVLDGFDRKDTRVKIQKLVEEHSSLKKNALKLAKDYFSVEVCADRYLRIYEKLAGKN
jgi:glycosyltransferase involved in cell wall biosynthesis